jgi:Transglutaminase-like superfamily
MTRSSRGWRRTKRVALELVRPADSLLAARILCWAAFVRLAKYAIPLRTLVQIVSPTPREGPRDPSRERQIAIFADRASRIVRPRTRGNCLERSLVSYRYLVRAHADPRLMIGFRRDQSGVLGHAWVLVDGQPLGDSPATLAEYQVAMSFGAGDRALVDPAR